MATSKPPLPGSSSSGSGSGKRRKLEGELTGTEVDISSKRRALDEAKEEFDEAKRALQRWNVRLEQANEQLHKANEHLQRWNDVLLKATSENLESRDYATSALAAAREEVKAIRQDARTAEERERAAEDRVRDARGRVQSLQMDLDQLKEQRSTTERRIQELGPDTSTYFRAIAALGAPSALTSRHAWWKAQTGDRDRNRNNTTNPLFLCFVPAEAQPVMPVELAEEVFSQFLVDAKQNVVDQGDCVFVDQLCDLVGQDLDKENDMATKFREILTEYLDCPVRIDTISCSLIKSGYPTDGSVYFLKSMALLTELKLEPKTTLFQAMQYYSLYLAGMKKEEREESFCPCFLIELVGTCIRISGLVYFGKVACQPLTPFLHCYTNVFDQTDMNTLCRAMRALKAGIHKLRDLHFNLRSAAVTRNKNVPYHLSLSGWEFQERIAGKLIFIMKSLETGEFKVVKFCRRYGVSVHEAWAQQDLAPKLIKWNLGPDGWYAIEMDFLDRAVWKSVHDWSSTPRTASSKSQLKETIANALARAHEISVNGRRTAHGDMRNPNIMTAHGDMRNPNIMVRESDQGGQATFEVKFLDFDWSGTVGDTLYPTFMNMDLGWHVDVGPGKPLHQEHDTHWLGALIGEH